MSKNNQTKEERKMPKTYEEGYEDGFNAYMQYLVEHQKHPSRRLKVPPTDSSNRAYVRGYLDGWDHARRQSSP